MEDYGKFENFSNFNKAKRIKIIDNILEYSKRENLSSVVFDSNDQDEIESNFECFFLTTNYRMLEDKEELIELSIRYAIMYLEEYNYELKIKGLDIIDHLVINATPNQLNCNFRSKLIFETFQKYLNDKESVQFLIRILKSMCLLLNIIESKYAISEHNYIQHSLVTESILNSCYMTSNNEIKRIYYENLIIYVNQIGVYSIRYFEKFLTIIFDCIENSNLGIDLERQESLINDALNLLENLIKVCFARVQGHAKKIINFLIMIIYLASLSNEGYNDKEYEFFENICFIQKSVRILNGLWKNKIVYENCFKEFENLKEKSPSKKIFSKLIKQICNVNLK